MAVSGPSIASTSKFVLHTEVFEHGLLFSPRVAALEVEDLLNLVQTAEEAPVIRYKTWQSWAEQHPQLELTSTGAWIYFSACAMLLSHHRPELVPKSFLNARTCPNRRERTKLKADVQLPLCEFVLFLFVQQQSRHSVRSVQLLEFPSEEAPRRPVDSDENDVESATYHVSQNLTTMAQFLRNHVFELATLLCGVHPAGDVECEEDLIPLVGEAALESLSFLLHVRGKPSPGGMHHTSLAELASHKDLHDLTGYIEEKGAFRCDVLSQFIRNNLSEPSKNCTQHCIAFPSPEPIPFISHPSLKGDSTQTSSQTSSPEKLLVLARLSKQLLVVDGRHVTPDASILIYRCRSCHIFVLGPVRNVSLKHCQRITLVCGAISSFFNVTACRRITLSATCGQFVCSATESARIHLCTNSVPVFLASTSRVSLAPFASSYPSLSKAMATANVNPKCNLWNKPFLAIPKGPHVTECSLLPPEELCPIVVPFHPNVDDCQAELNPCDMPEDYRAALVENAQRLLRLQARLEEASEQEPGLASTFRSSVKDRFQEWLHQSGRGRQLQAVVNFRSQGSLNSAET